MGAVGVHGERTEYAKQSAEGEERERSAGVVEQVRMRAHHGAPRGCMGGGGRAGSTMVVEQNEGVGNRALAYS